MFAPAIVLVILAVFGILGFIPIRFGEGYGKYIFAAVSVLLVFGSAIGLSVFVRGAGWISRCLASPKQGSLLLSISAAGMMMVQSAGIRSFLTENFYDYRTYPFYGLSFESMTDSTGALICMFLVLVLLPVLLEEILFRGCLLHEYRYGGVFLSVIVSSFLYAMTGMSPADFPIHFLNGVLLSAVVFLTGNLFCSVLAHLLYALFVLSIEKYIFFMALETRILILLVLLALWLFAVIGFCGSAEKILRQKGENEERMPVRLQKGKFFIVLRDVFSAPIMWADIFCFALVCVLHIFLDA